MSRLDRVLAMFVTLLAALVGACVGLFVTWILVLVAVSDGVAVAGGDGGAVIEGTFLCFSLVTFFAGGAIGSVLGNRIATQSVVTELPDGEKVDACSFCGVNRLVTRGIFCELCQREPYERPSW